MKRTKDIGLKSEKGMATVEALPLLVIYVMLISYGMGLYGAIHTAVLHNIHARTYAFETFRNRADLMYFRGNIDADSANLYHHQNTQIRLHGIRHTNGGVKFTASRRSIRVGSYEGSVDEGDDSSTHANKINNLGKRNREVGVNPIWVRILYGICVTPSCGD